jgi:myo-inositol-1(or 4)-monophosphatase
MPADIGEVGRRAARAAGEILRTNYRKPHHIILKGVIDPVTESDYQSQSAVIGIIRESFPDHGILAEESAGQGGGGRSSLPVHRWIIDPLDGTVNFAHGFPMFCVSIAFEVNGVLEYGVVYEPLRDELFEAKRGGGAFLNGEAIRVSTVKRLEGALLATGFPYDIRERLPETLARMGRILGVAQGVRRAGSAALDLAYVAAGRLDGFWEEHLKPWDTAAGILLVQEAGGQITTIEGEAYRLASPTILASNGQLHGEIVKKLGGI